MPRLHPGEYPSSVMQRVTDEGASTAYRLLPTPFSLAHPSFSFRNAIVRSQASFAAGSL